MIQLLLLLLGPQLGCLLLLQLCLQLLDIAKDARILETLLTLQLVLIRLLLAVAEHIAVPQRRVDLNGLLKIQKQS